MGSKLLPPIEAVQLAWARTGAFSNDDHSQRYATEAENNLKDIQERAAEEPYKGKEQEYVSQVSGLIESSLRVLDTIYKGRDLDFKENAKLRESYLESAKDILNFGTRARDYLKALPGTALGGTIGVWISTRVPGGDNTLVSTLLGVAIAILGYGVNRAALFFHRKMLERYYVRQDYERSLYFQRYVLRSEIALKRLYNDVKRIHNKVFRDDDESAAETRRGPDETKNLLAAIRPSLCPKVHEHMREGIVSAKLWPLCETGGPNAETGIKCKHWKGPVPAGLPGIQQTTATD